MTDVVTCESPQQVVTRQRNNIVQTQQRQRTVVTQGQAGPSNSGDGGTYTNVNPTPATVGGVAAGSTFSGLTFQQVFNELFYPYQAPAFTAFALSGVSSPLEVGASFGPSVTFTWSTSNGGNVAANSIAITDITSSTSVVTGAGNTGSHAANTGSAVTRSTAGNHQFGISGTNSNSGTFSGSLTLQWEWREYYGASGNATLSAANVLGLASSRLTTGYAGTYAMAAGGYKYICLADANGGQLNSVKDQATGFSVPMATTADNAAYSNTDGGGYNYALVSVTNAQGVTANVRCYRTLNILGGAITMVVT